MNKVTALGLSFALYALLESSNTLFSCALPQVKTQDTSQEALNAQLLEAAQLPRTIRCQQHEHPQPYIDDAAIVVQMLLNQKASATCQDENGDTPLHHAIKPRYVDYEPENLVTFNMYPDFFVCGRMIRILALANGDPNRPNNAGETVNSIIEQKCTEFQTTLTGGPPYHYSDTGCYPEIVWILESATKEVAYLKLLQTCLPTKTIAKLVKAYDNRY